MPGGGPPRRGEVYEQTTEDAGAPGHLRRDKEQEVESVLLNQQPTAAEPARAPPLHWWPTTTTSTHAAAAAPTSSGTAGITSSSISFNFPSNFTSGELLVPQRATTGGRRRQQQQHGAEELPPESSTRSRIMAEKLLENFDGLSPTTSSIFSSSTSSRETSIGGFLQPAPSSSPTVIYGQHQQRQGTRDADATMHRRRTTMEQGLVGSSTTATRPEQQGVVLSASVVMPTLEEQETCRGSERPLVEKQESTTRGITTGDYSASSPVPRTEVSPRPAAAFDPRLAVAASNFLHLLDFSSLSDEEEEQRAGTTAPAYIDQHRVTESSGRDDGDEEVQEEVLPFLEEQEPQYHDAIPRPHGEERSSHLPAAGGARERRKRRQQEEQYQSTAADSSSTRKKTRMIIGTLDTRATKTAGAVTTTTTTATKDRRSAGHDDGSRRRTTILVKKKEQQSSTATSSSGNVLPNSRDRPIIIIEGRTKEDYSSDGGSDDEDDAKLPAQNFAIADASSPRTWTRRDRQSDLPSMGSTERSPGGEEQEQPRGVRATSSNAASSQHQEQPARLSSPLSAANDRKTKKWDEHYRDLLAFKQEHGHCNVPFGHIEHPLLGHWVKRQRYQYKRKTKGDHSQLTDQRQQLLDDVGFVWDSHAGAWEEQFTLIQQHWKANGHCFVAAKDNKELNAWSKRQRRQYRLYQTNPSKSTLTDERIRRLDELNFPWQLLSSSGEPQESSAASAEDTTSDSVVARSRTSTSR